MENHIIFGLENEKEKENIGNKLDDFEILQTLGKGSYGYVAKVKSKLNNEIYAMKMIDFSLIKDQIEVELSLNEIKIIQSLDSPHIIKYYNSFSVDKKMYILMEYINNGDIKGYIAAHQNMGKPIPEDELWELFYQCMSGLSCIHQNNLIHRDIKPANLFLTDDKTIKIGDFGVSANRNKNQNQNTQTKSGKETMMIGTPLYMSPEMFKHEKYGSKVDIYSLGCTFHEMCYYFVPRIPIPVMNMNLEISTELQEVAPKFNAVFYSQDVTNLIKLMIEKDPKKRPATQDVFNIIKNKYNSTKKQNSSINSVYKCLFSFQGFKKRLLKHKDNIGPSKPISCSFKIAYDNRNNINNWANQLKLIRDLLTFNNSCFIDPGEIEPEELIDFILKKLHIENNKLLNTYSRLYTLDSDPDISNRPALLTKYYANFLNIFKSFISDLFFGTLETSATCFKCTRVKYYFENYYYLTLDLNQAIKCGINPNYNDFIQNCIKNEISSSVNKERFCPYCNSKEMQKENRKIQTLPSHLIINIKNEDKISDNQNVNFPFSLNFSFLNLDYSQGDYSLVGIIKKFVDKGKKYFGAIYADYENPNQAQWILSDGVNFQSIQTPLNHSVGKAIMLFYSSKNN